MGHRPAAAGASINQLLQQSVWKRWPHRNTTFDGEGWLEMGSTQYGHNGSSPFLLLKASFARLIFLSQALK